MRWPSCLGVEDWCLCSYQIYNHWILTTFSSSMRRCTVLLRHTRTRVLPISCSPMNSHDVSRIQEWKSMQFVQVFILIAYVFLPAVHQW